MDQLRDEDVDHMTLTEIEQEWHRLKQKTTSIYADLAANARETLEKAGKLKHE